MKRAVVTGASGFIGYALAKKLVKLGIDVIAVDLVPFPDKNLCPFVKMDLAEGNGLDPLLTSGTCIFHLAARANVPQSVEDPKGDFKDTLYGLFEVLESARRHESQVIFPSTACIYDTSNAQPVSEKAYVRPSSPYAAAKVAGEAYCSAYHRCYDLDVRIARMFSVYGEGMRRFAIHDIVRKIQKDHRVLNVLGDGTQVRDYLHIDDVFDGMMTIATKGKPGEDYNLASGIPVNILDLAKEIAALMGHPDIRIVPTGTSFPGDVPRWYADIGKIKKLGFEPQVELRTGLQKTVDWLTANETSPNERYLFQGARD